MATGNVPASAVATLAAVALVAAACGGDSSSETPLPISTFSITTTTRPPPRSTTTTSLPPASTTTTMPASDPMLIGAGDIADANTFDSQTAELIAAFPNATVFTTGDHVYPDGTAEEFAAHYDPTWGVFKERTRPSIGNHDDHVEGAGPYFEYFGDNAGTPGEGWYSYDLASWHIIVLNSECDNTGLESCDAQTVWLQADLTANVHRCMLAYWHKPVFNSGRHADGYTSFADEWEVLDTAGVDVAVNGHDHNYQRYAPQGASGMAKPSGMREFVVGTGGAGLYEQTVSLPNLEQFYEGHGVLKLDLRPTSYDWMFLSIDGSYTDSGTGTCDDA